ncbi:glycosyl hydrolase [Streptomyces sp. NPDC048282]|uniref:glycosyl hydrolase n=1 Tax=Streptomyces sp. NPDC048282 TaxID=3365528 RepID=UPI00371F72C7
MGTFDGVSQALAASGASWYYTWNTRHQGVTAPGPASFVPMIWGAASVTDAPLAQARAAGPYLLGFNEPDMAQQSNMTVEQGQTGGRDRRGGSGRLAGPVHVRGLGEGVPGRLHHAALVRR